jgi:hypothetical protein
MKKRAKLLLEKSLASLLLTIEHFNRPWDLGRHEAVLIFMDRAFELFMKAAIVEKGGSIRDKGSKETIGFEKCVRKCISDVSIAIMTEEEALTIQIINSLRDAAQHYLLDISEQQLYVYCHSGMGIYCDLLQNVFNESISDHLPDRVLPISTMPPRDLYSMIDVEFKDIQDLVKPGSRRQVEARAKLRGLSIVDSSLGGTRTQPSDYELRKLVTKIKRGTGWKELFPALASLKLTTSDEGPNVSLRITKKEGESVHLVPEGTPGATVVAVKRVNELGFYSMGLYKLAEKIGLTPPKTLALIRYLGIQDSDDYFKVIRIGKSKYKRYSPKALDLLHKELPNVNMQEVWELHKPQRRRY